MNFQATAYDVLNDDGGKTGVRIEYRGDESWAIVTGGRNLSKSGTWDWEPLSSSRTVEWKAEHRWTLEDAQRRLFELELV